MWVRSEYAGELAVLSTWLCALLPWSVTIARLGDVSTLFFWFLPGNFVFAPGLELERPFWVWNFPGFFTQSWETLLIRLWLAGVAVFLVALAISIAYYLKKDWVESWRVDPVRILGGLLLASGALFFAAFVQLWQNHPGTSLPVGTLFLLVFGAILLRTERLDSDTE